ncbi:glycosyltransferase [Butyrivibrio sp. JL13D10]|uniref:glycosyltransferase n=1 Tax=Butyrivibrio sp. JL13D10 TaxID=3236815 RepID=UPI0038B59E04
MLKGANIQRSRISHGESHVISQVASHGVNHPISHVAKSVIKRFFSYTMRERIRGRFFDLAYPFKMRQAIDLNKYPAGINLIGHIRGDFGLGESCRLVADTINEAGIPFIVKNIFQNKSADETNTKYAEFESEELRYNINLVHINPNEMVSFLLKSKREDFDNRYMIAFWLWELPEFPPEWVYQIKMFDEVWTPSDFVSDAIRKVTDKPVFTVPYAMKEPVTDDKYDREYFGLPSDKFLYLMSYDGLSNSERKNPDGAIAAYKAAFQLKHTDDNAESCCLRELSEIKTYKDNSEVGLKYMGIHTSDEDLVIRATNTSDEDLVIRVTNTSDEDLVNRVAHTSDVGLIIKATHASDAEITHIKKLLEGYDNIYILTDSYSKTEFNSLIKCADAHISLHRSEGFGLVMAEAMFLGTPSVATKWSANAEFMSDGACCMVPAKIIEIKKETPPYHKGCHWADPDVDAAADYIRRLYLEKKFYDHKKEQAGIYIRERFSSGRGAAIIKSRVDEIMKKEIL